METNKETNMSRARIEAASSMCEINVPVAGKAQRNFCQLQNYKKFASKCAIKIIKTSANTKDNIIYLFPTGRKILFRDFFPILYRPAKIYVKSNLLESIIT
jgi:hypothetical protein